MLQVVPWNEFHKTAVCPYCREANKFSRYATTTDKEKGIRYRYHRCTRCNETFKSVQLDREKNRDLTLALHEVLTVHRREENERDAIAS